MPHKFPKKNKNTCPNEIFTTYTCAIFASTLKISTKIFDF